MDGANMQKSGEGYESDDSVIFVHEVRGHNLMPPPLPEVVVLATVQGPPSVGSQRVHDLSETDGSPDGAQMIGSSDKDEETEGGVVDLEASSDSELDYDSDEEENDSTSSLENIVDYRSESDISVSLAKDYIEVLEERLERRLRRKSKKIIRKKHKAANTCKCSCHGIKPRNRKDDHDGDDNDGRSSDTSFGGGSRARRALFI